MCVRRDILLGDARRGVPTSSRPRTGGEHGPRAVGQPIGTDGFEFVEYTAPDPAELAALFERLGFVAAARHRSKNVTLYKQGDVNFILNAEAESFAQDLCPAARPFGLRESRSA